MKSKVTGIQPEGATMTRADGSAINVGDDVDDVEPVTITIPAGSSGGSVQFGSGSARREGVAERVGGGILFERPLAAPASVTVPALVVSDTAQPERSTVLARVGSIGARALNPPAVKVE